MTIDLTHGFGMIPYGHGLYGYGMTVEGDADASIVAADLDLNRQALGGSAGATAIIQPLDIDMSDGTAKGYGARSARHVVIPSPYE